MTGNSEHWLNSKWMSYVKYCLLGSFISFNVGWAVVIFICFSKCFRMDNIFYIAIIIGLDPTTMILTILNFSTFLVSLIVKLIKKDIPWYIYCNTGLIYGITLCCYFEYVNTFIHTMVYNDYNVKIALIEAVRIDKPAPLLILIITTYIASFLGGFIVDVFFILRHYKTCSMCRYLRISIILFIILSFILTIRYYYSTNYWNERAIKLDGHGKYEEAIKCYDVAIKLDSKCVKALLYKGLDLYRQDKYEEAIKCYDTAIEMDPNNARVWICKGAALYKLNNKSQEAGECYIKAFILDPNLDVRPGK